MAFEIVFKPGTTLIPLSKIFGIRLSDGSTHHLQQAWILNHQNNPPTIVLLGQTRFFLSIKSHAMLIGFGSETVTINLNSVEKIYDSVKRKVLWPPQAPPKKGIGGGGQGFEFL